MYPTAMFMPGGAQHAQLKLSRTGTKESKDSVHAKVRVQKDVH